MKQRDRGYAMVAAVAAIAVFGLISLDLITSGRSAQRGLEARFTRARLLAAADAGIATAVHGLAMEGRGDRWPIDGRTRTLTFDGVALAVTVSDERGKIPLNSLTDSQARDMFEVGGAEGEALDRITDAFLDWRDDDDEPRDYGAEAADYPAGRPRPRNGALQSVGELAFIAGMQPEIFRKLRPAVTVFFGNSGGFSPETAHPLALAVMLGGGEDSADVLIRERELAGARTALEIARDQDLRGRAVTVEVAARDGRGGQAFRSAIVELTGDPERPYWIRNLN
ncbi:MAG: type II secretion system protein GspK [Caulobacter sp.]|nr:type II secretion system protein GspK [Caulobacter sp.]